MRKLVLALISFLAVVVAAVTVSATATGAPAEDVPLTLEEDYTYPGAAKILAEKGIKLIKGDGNIVLVDCVSGTGQAEVRSRTKGHLCFQVRGATGALTMEIPEAYLILGAGGHNIEAKIAIEGVASSITVLKNEYRGIGESGPSGKPAVLLEFRATAV